MDATDEVYFGDRKAPEETFDRAREKLLVRKLDRHIVPWIVLLYLLAFLDRVNIGNAKLYGMEVELGLDSTQFDTAVAVFFSTYCLCQTPSNILLPKVGASRWLAFIVTGWGIIATLTGVVRGFSGLLVARIFLGVVEAGLYPGVTVYFSMFYPKSEIALRQSYLGIASSLAGACGGLIAYGIGYMNNVGGYSSWRWIFIIEGLPSVLAGVITLFWLADNPETAWFLTPDEKALVRARLRRQTGFTDSGQKVHKEDVIATFKDWKCWLLCSGLAGIDTVLYGFSTFAPTIVSAVQPSYTAIDIQALTVPCYISAAISCACLNRLSDIQQRRAVYGAGSAMISIVGYAILLSDVSSGVYYFACFLVPMGVWSAGTLITILLVTNYPRIGKRTAAVGLQLTCGNLAGIWSSYLYPNGDAPRYIRGHAATLVLTFYTVVVYMTMLVWFTRENKKRLRGERDHRAEGKTEEEIAELGDESPRFLYTK
ncbi:MAG: hypothetical protein M1831_005744 [Alyxoria varia]|nr:MAG: hypothetical protein M1831_005744 [Alyxoria varia]